MQWLGLRPLQVSREQAIQIATRYMMENGLAATAVDEDPVAPRAGREGVRWRVWMTPNYLGGRWVIVDGRTGAVAASAELTR